MAEKVGMESEARGEELRQELLEFERQGKTGFDCGLSYLVIRDEELKKEAKKKIGENLTKNIYVTTYQGIPALMFGLRDYPLNVQSTTMQSTVLRSFMEFVEKRSGEKLFSEVTWID